MLKSCRHLKRNLASRNQIFPGADPRQLEKYAGGQPVPELEMRNLKLQIQ